MSSLNYILHNDAQSSPSLSQTVKNFIFPPVSESKIVLLMFLAYIFCLTNRDVVVPYVLHFLIDKPAESPKAVIWAVVFTGLGLYGLYLLVLNAISNRTMKLSEKVILAGFFYGILSLFSLHSVLASLKSNLSPLDLYLSLYILIRSGITLLTLYGTFRAKIQSIYAMQLNDVQVKAYELLLILILSLACYFYFSATKPAVTAVTLSYFYISLILMILSSIVSLFSKKHLPAQPPYQPAPIPTKTE